LDRLICAQREWAWKAFRYSEGDTFVKIDSADAVIMKMNMYDWNDKECIRFLSNAWEADPVGGHVLLADFVVEPPNRPTFATGRERTQDENR